METQVETADVLSVDQVRDMFRGKGGKPVSRQAIQHWIDKGDLVPDPVETRYDRDGEVLRYYFRRDHVEALAERWGGRTGGRGRAQLNTARTEARDERKGRVLEYLTTRPYATLNEIAAALSLPVTTSHRYVQSLRREGRLVWSRDGGWRVP